MPSPRLVAVAFPAHSSARPQVSPARSPLSGLREGLERRQGTGPGVCVLGRGGGVEHRDPGPGCSLLTVEPHIQPPPQSLSSRAAASGSWACLPEALSVRGAPQPCSSARAEAAGPRRCGAGAGRGVGDFIPPLFPCPKEQ